MLNTLVPPFHNTAIPSFGGSVLSLPPKTNLPVGSLNTQVLRKRPPRTGGKNQRDNSGTGNDTLSPINWDYEPRGNTWAMKRRLFKRPVDICSYCRVVYDSVRTHCVLSVSLVCQWIPFRLGLSPVLPNTSSHYYIEQTFLFFWNEEVSKDNKCTKRISISWQIVGFLITCLRTDLTKGFVTLLIPKHKCRMCYKRDFCHKF